MRSSIRSAGATIDDGGWSTFRGDVTVPGNTPSWRRYSDAVNRGLIARWLPRRVDRLLKTDLFDECLGDGLIPEMRRRADRVTGIDISRSVAEAASARHSDLEAVHADVRELPFEDGTFDAVISNSTLDHMPSWTAVEDALAEIVRVLRAGGRLVVTFDNAANPVVSARGSIAAALPRALAARLVPYEQGLVCDLDHLRALLEASGLAVAQLEPVMHCPRLPAVELAHWRDRRYGPSDRLARMYLAFERLGALPTRARSAYFVAACALKGAPGPASPPSHGRRRGIAPSRGDRI